MLAPFVPSGKIVSACGNKARLNSRPSQPFLVAALLCALAVAGSPAAVASGTYAVDVLPDPVQAGEPFAVLVTGISSGCGEITLTQSSSSGSFLYFRLDDSGCPILPPGPFEFLATATGSPLVAGTYNVSIRDPEFHELVSTQILVVDTAPAITLDKHLFTSDEKVVVGFPLFGHCPSLPQSAVESTLPLAHAFIGLYGCEANDSGDPPTNVELGKLPAGFYELRAVWDPGLLDPPPLFRSYFEVRNDLPLFSTLPAVPTNRDEVTLRFNFPGRQLSSCRPLILEQHINATFVYLRLDETCIVPEEDHSVFFELPVGLFGTGDVEVLVNSKDQLTTLLDEHFAVIEGGHCVPSETQLCLQGGRFSVTAQWQVPGGNVGAGHARQATGDSGTFWFFEPENVELDVKVLNGCPINQRFWVFASGLTNVAVNLRVTDTANGEDRSYFSEAPNAYSPVQDTQAFATCP